MFILTSPSRFEQDIKKSRFLALAARYQMRRRRRLLLQRILIATPIIIAGPGGSDRTIGSMMTARTEWNSRKAYSSGHRWSAIDEHRSSGHPMVWRHSSGKWRAGARLRRNCCPVPERCNEEERVIPSITVVVDLNFSDHASIKARLPSLGSVAIIQETFTGDGASLYLQIQKRMPTQSLQRSGT